MTTLVADTQAAEKQVARVQGAARAEELRREMEQTRAAFHALLAEVAAARWREKSPTTEWSVGEVFVHLTWALEYLPKEVEAAREGRGMFNMPNWVGAPLSFWYVRWLARSATPASLSQRYDSAMERVIRLLDTIPDDDWSKGADFYGEGFHSVEDLLHSVAKHFGDHTAGMARQGAAPGRGNA